jgi:penicillin-binding protein 1A
MESLLVKIFGVILTLSQVLTQPDDIKTKFDPARDREEVVDLLRKGCSHIRSAFAIEDLDLDELIATAMDDRDAVSAKFRDVSFTDMHAAYRVICNQEKEALPFDVGELIEFQNLALMDLPDHEVLGRLKLPGTTTILDRHGEKFAEVYEPANRRVSVPLGSVSPLLKAAFIAAEDKRFYEHKGVDERGIIRAFIVNLAGDKNLQGGSTITQQVAKNLLVGTTNNYVRKMREMVIASRMERSLSKDRIFEIYLNAIYFGRGAWGVETAAKHYFGKSADALTLAESAMLAGLAKGPNLYNPDRNPDRARERFAYVLTRMKEDGAIDAAELESALVAPAVVVAYHPHKRDKGFHYVDYVAQQAKRLAGINLLTEESYVIRSTIDPELQRAAETALQDGLAAYERQTGRARFSEAELNIADRVREADARDNPAWLSALRAARPQLYDVHWPIAVVLPQAAGKKQPERLQSERLTAGLLDGRVVPLELARSARGRLKAYDVVYVQVTEKTDGGARAELRVRPQVQGAALVLENKTGQILALAGGFSYPLSQLNRVTQAWRQPGSALKPLTYLAALAKGLQPNTLISDAPITLPPIGKAARRNRDSYWSPQNYDSRSRGSLSLRQALEASRNLPTAHLLAGGIADKPEASLDKVCELAREAQLYRSCSRYYPFILGAQPVRMLDLARFYATVANEGTVPDIHAIASISVNRELRYEHARPAPIRIEAADSAAFYQLKSILQGVVLKGTAARMSHLAPYIAGKTGTTDDEIDAWFVGFSNDVTVAVWVGYDNAREKRDLGSGRTGANVAIPIFEPIIQASWKIYPKSELAPPSAEALEKLVPEGQSKEARNRDTRNKDNRQRRTRIVEYIRKDAKGKAIDARYALLGKSSRFDVTARRQRGHEAFATDTGGAGWQGQWFNNGNQGRWGQRPVTDSGFGFGGHSTYDQHGAFRYKY